MNKFLLAMIFMFYMPGAMADVYKCKDANGSVVFSQRVCGDDASKVNLKKRKRVYSSGPMTKAGAERLREIKSIGTRQVKTSESYAYKIKKRNLDNKINRLKAKRRGLGKKRDKNIEKLQDRLRSASTKERVILQSKIRSERDRYYSERSRLGDKIYDLEVEYISKY